MALKLRFSILFFIVISFSFAQSADSLKAKNKRSVSFALIAGTGFIADVNMPYKNQPGDDGTASINYNDKDFNQHFYKRMPVLKALFSGSLTKYFGFDWGLKYSNFITNADLQIVQRPGIYYHFSSHLTSAITEVQTFIGPSITIRNFYFSATVNPGMLSMKQTAWDNGSQYIHNKRTMQYCTGAGVNAGYELPLKKNALLFELECDYVSRRQDNALNYFGRYNFELLNPAVCIGYKFTGNSNRHPATGSNDSIQAKKQHRFSFEILAGAATLSNINKTYDDLLKPNNFGYTIHTHLYFTSRYTSNSIPILKLAFNCKLNKYLGIGAGLQYSFFNTDFNYDTRGYSNADPANFWYISHESTLSHIHELQLFIAPKINFKNAYLMVKLNLNGLLIHQTTKTHSSDSYSYSNGYDDNETSYHDPEVLEQLCPGAGLNLGYNFPTKKNHAIKVELDCDYFYREMNTYGLGVYKYRTINPGLCIGFKF